MQVEETAIPAVKIIMPKKHGDDRGFFSEVYNRADWDKAGLELTFVQDNHSFSAVAGTLRGCTSRRRLLRRTSWCVARAGGSWTSRSTFVARRRPSAGMSRSNSRRTIGASCWFRSGLRTPSSPWSPTSRSSTRRPLPIRPPATAASPGTIQRSALIGHALSGGPVLSDKDRRLPRLKDAPDLFE